MIANIKTKVQLFNTMKIRSFEKLKTIGNIVFYLDENGIKRMATKERFKEILKEQSIWNTKL